MSATNRAGTFVYSPDISVAVGTKDGPIDISADIIDFTLDRNINAVSTFQCTLANPNRKYNRKINTMDRITVFLKRTHFVQVFSGYITYAPIETLVPTPVTIAASCTLRILQTTYWDDTLIEFQQLLLNFMDQAAATNAGQLNDGGVAQAIVNILYKVTGWNRNNIHIQSIPQKFLDFAATVYSSQIISNQYLSQDVMNNLATAIGTAGYVSGNSVTTGGQVLGSTQIVTDTAAPPGTDITFNSRVYPFVTKPIGNGGKANYPGANPDNPVSIDLINQDTDWCSIPFGYLGFTDQTAVTKAKDWIKHNRVANTNDGRLLLLGNKIHNRYYAVRATSVPQKPNSVFKGKAVVDKNFNYLQCHPSVVAYLNGTVADPGDWKPSMKITYANVHAAWADQTVVSHGKQVALSQKVKKDINSALAITDRNASSDNAMLIDTYLQAVVQTTLNQVGAKYSQKRGHRTTPHQPGNKGSFDCSGLAEYVYEAHGIKFPNYPYNDTISLYAGGPNQPSGAASKYGQFIPSSTMPRRGDLLFWYEPGNTTEVPPDHVSIMVSDFGFDENGRAISSNEAVVVGAAGYTDSNGNTVGVVKGRVYWNQMRNGSTYSLSELYRHRAKTEVYMGARRPATLHPNWGAAYARQSASSPSTNPQNNANDPNQRTNLMLTGAYNSLLQSPQYDVRASAIVGTPRAFILDKPVMGDLTQIMSAGLRCYQSAPNGDFVAWFPDYYGLYGTDPVLEISDVEIIDFQIYHDDNQLATHVGIIGDTTGIGQQINFADFITTNGIVSVQDGATMQMLFGLLKNNGTNTYSDEAAVTAANNFLQRYGIRPFVQEQNMIHSHTLEYLYALQVFMQQWVQQYVSNVQFTFMPELYPGMRIVIHVDDESGASVEYQFYCTSVTHQGSRSSGFTTQAQLTAPIKGGKILDYGLDIAQ